MRVKKSSSTDTPKALAMAVASNSVHPLLFLSFLLRVAIEMPLFLANVS